MLPRLVRIAVGVVLGLLVLFAGTLILSRALDEREPLYEGKTLFFWVGQLNTSDVTLSNRAHSIVETKIRPELTTKMFTDLEDSKVKVFLIERLNGLPNINIQFVPADGRRSQAAAQLGQLGPHGKAAVPDLVKALKGKDAAIRASAAKALGKIQSNPEVVIPLLTACLEDPQDGVPEAAIEGLGDFGSLSKPALPKLLPFVQSRDKDIRHAISIALPRIDAAGVANAGVK